MASRQHNLGILRQLTKEFRGRTAVRAVREAESIIADGWRDRVPVRSGAYRDSIRETPVKSNRNFTGGAVVATSGHALFVEFGTEHMHADPAMRDAIDQDGPRAVAAMVRVLSKGIR